MNRRMEVLMLNEHNDLEQEHEQFHSRRRFFAWAGQIAAGVSLAGIGLGLTDPLKALAATKPQSAMTHKRVRPDCYPCPDPGTFCCRSCFTDSHCQPGGHTALTYDYNGGCVSNPSDCPTYIACSRCVSSCPTNC